MRDDGMQSEQVEHVQRVVNIRRNGEVSKFNQQIIFLVQRVLCRTHLDIGKIFITQVKIASGSESGKVHAEPEKLLCRTHLDIGKIFITQVKIASGSEFQPAFHFCLKFISEFECQLGTESVLGIRVWSGNDVRNALLNGDFGHLDGNFHGLRSVVNAGKNVAVDINH